MDVENPNGRICDIAMKDFLDYSRSISNSEDTIYHLRAPNILQQSHHLDIVDIPHENVALNECWNFLDIPLSTQLDPRLTCVSLPSSLSLHFLFPSDCPDLLQYV